MMMFTVAMAVMVAVTVAVGAALGLKRGLHLRELCSEAMEHFLDHVVGPKAKNLASNFRRQMPVSEVPGKTYELMWILMSDFDNRFRSSLNFQPSPVFELQAVSVGHGNRFRQIEEDLFSLVHRQANAAAMARVKIERESA
jgi:hypothetical protein